MKTFLIAAIFILSVFITSAQKSITIDVEHLKKPVSKLRVNNYQAILEDLIKSDSTTEDDIFNGKTITPKFDIVAKSEMPYNLVNFGYHPFFEGMYHAYADHRPFTLSPDIMWLLICQGFSQHVNNNSEKLRHLFVDFNGKTSLVVRNDKIQLNDPNSPWQDVFPEFSKKISENTGKDLTETLTADFSTTTLVSKMASQITLMDAMKSYFEFIVIRVGCGIPKITIEGTTDDWQKVLTKTEALRKYDLDWWVDELAPVLKKIIAASKGEVDKDFWRGMFKYHNGVHCGTPAMANGWIVKFFPYNKKGSRNNLDSIGLKDILPNEIVKVDLTYEDLPGNGDVKKTPLELWAGFVGLRQNDKTFNLKPEIGWMIRKKNQAAEDLASELKSKNNKTDDPEGGIAIRVKIVPEELLHIGPIHSLTIEFTDGINIPDEMGKIKIDKLSISGTIKFEERERIYRIFPHTTLYINNQQIVDGKPVQY